MLWLALQMGRTPSELAETMSIREFLEYSILFRLCPLGDEAAALRSGLISSTIANVNRDPERRPDPYLPTDFIPLLER